MCEQNTDIFKDSGHIFHNNYISYMYPSVKGNTPSDKVHSMVLIVSVCIVLCETAFKQSGHTVQCLLGQYTDTVLYYSANSYACRRGSKIKLVSHQTISPPT